MSLLNGDFFNFYDGGVKSVGFLDIPGFATGFTITDDGFGNGDDVICELHGTNVFTGEELTGDCITRYFIFQFGPQIREDNNYGFIKFY